MYATAQDIIDRYGEEAYLVAFDRSGAGMADEIAAARALGDAGDEIDGYLSGRYSLPLSTVPRILTYLCVDIAVYKGSVGSVGTEEQRRRYEDAIRFLTKVAEGKIRLGLAAEDEPPGREGMLVAAPAKQFSRADLEKY